MRLNMDTMVLGVALLCAVTFAWLDAASRTELAIKIDGYIEKWIYGTRIAEEEALARDIKIYALKGEMNDLISNSKLVAEPPYLKENQLENKIENLEDYTKKCKDWCSIAVYKVDGKIIGKASGEKKPESDKLFNRNFFKGISEYHRMEISMEHDSIYGGHTYFVVGVPILSRRGNLIGIVRSSLDLEGQWSEWDDVNKFIIR
jgi:hypothetical protein